MGRISGLLFLIGLAVSAAKLPQYFARFSNSASALRTLAPSAKLPETEFGSSVYVHDTGGVDQALIENLDEESRQMVKDVSAGAQIQMNPLMGALLKSSKRGAGASAGTSKFSFGEWTSRLEKSRPVIIFWVWRVPAVLLLAGMAAIALQFKASGRALVGLCRSLCNKGLFLLSLLALAVYFWQHVNLWLFLPSEAWGVPVLFSLASVATFRFIDENYPLWKSTVKGFLAPLSASFIILLFDRFSGF